MTTSQNEIVYSFEKMLSPLNKYINVPKISFIITFGIKFINVVIYEAKKIFDCMAIKGVDIKSKKIKDKFYALTNFITPLIFNSIKRADNFANIMEVRNFDVNKSKSYLHIYKWNIKDTLFVLIYAIIILEMVMLCVI
jgi:energy-coupling factor transport system ATP-binding protein